MNLSNKTEKPLISFLVTAYNLPADMLRQCIESIMAIDLPAHRREIILVDDGSDELAAAGLGALLHDVVYIRQRNQGLSVARNTALQNANGEYIQFVDGDDALLPKAYRHCIDIADSRKPDIVIFGRTTGREIVAAGDRADGWEDKSYGGSQYLLHRNLRAAAWGYLFRRAVLGELRFTPQLLHEDEEFTPLLFLRAETVVETTARAYFYRQRSHSITTETSSSHTDQRLSDMERTVGRLHYLADRMPKADRDALNRRVAQLAMAYLYETARLTKSPSRLTAATQQLATWGLFPLPDKGYTRKYQLFRQLTRNAAGRLLLIGIAKYHREQ